jgi:hypothetical protein
MLLVGGCREGFRSIMFTAGLRILRREVTPPCGFEQNYIQNIYRY